MSLTQGIFSVVGSILLLGVGYYFKGIIRELSQRVADSVNKAHTEDGRKEAQKDNQRANDESDALKKIDQR